MLITFKQYLQESEYEKICGKDGKKCKRASEEKNQVNKGGGQKDKDDNKKEN